MKSVPGEGHFEESCIRDIGHCSCPAPYWDNKCLPTMASAPMQSNRGSHVKSCSGSADALQHLPSPTLQLNRNDADADAATMVGLVLIPVSLYLLWACLYYLQIFVFGARKIQERGYQVSEKQDIFLNLLEVLLQL